MSGVGYYEGERVRENDDKEEEREVEVGVESLHGEATGEREGENVFLVF